jgi:isopenicillin-N N-acyltransferase-like protein
MRRRLKRITLIFLFVVITIATGLYAYLAVVATVQPPEPGDPDALSWRRELRDDSLLVVGKNWLRKSKSGLYEMYTEGPPSARGIAEGKLTKELSQYQEQVFTGQIHQLVPSHLKLQFLKYFVGWFNRNLDENVKDEYKQEILGIALAASPEFDDIAPPYQRILNYHAAHDIGHMLQNLSLVGCTSFAVWGDRSADSQLLVGRNFDFYVGDDFAKNKIIGFHQPAEGFPFVSVGFPGMIGVLSGMNTEGLTVTINAAKSEPPVSSATPVSLVAREILQYASTIDEAFQIAKNRNTFVSETFLVASDKDHKAVVIEKTPEQTEIYQVDGNQITCTNHFQGDLLGNTMINKTHMATSASEYRQKRLEQLLDGVSNKVTVNDAALILRNTKGMDDKSIGLGNEKTVNQLIAHHSVIFQPHQRRMWVSTAPWQMGKYVCYDLDSILNASMKSNHELVNQALTIPPDTSFTSSELETFMKYANYRFPFHERETLVADSIIRWNPDSYHAYMLAGDASMQREDYKAAGDYYKTALTKEIATVQEREYIVRQLVKCKEQSQ